jgi:hypothetical protein
VADYGVNIAVAVKNTQAITKLSRDTDLLGQKIRNANDALERFGDLNGKTVVNSVANFNKELVKAAENFDSVRLGSDRAADSARNFARAQDLANESLREQAALLAEVRNQGRSGTLRGGTQYSGPIGPGFGGFPATKPGDISVPAALRSPLPQSSPTALRSPLPPISVPVALRSRLPRMIETAQAGKIASDMEEVYASILRLTEKAHQEEAEKLQILRQGTKEVEELAQKYRVVNETQKTGKQLQLQIRRNILETKQAAAEEARIANQGLLDRLRNLESVGAERRKQFIQFNKEENEKRQIRMRELDFEERLAKVQARNRDRAERGRRAASSALIGGAFPLLFGQGLGASAGGLVGGFGGGMIGGEFGFGLSLIGTQIGTMFDELVAKAGALANSLSTTQDVLSGLEEAGFKVSDSTKSVIASYEEAGLLADAYSLAVDEINRVLGPGGVDKLHAYKTETEKLQAEFENASAALQSELLPALTGFLRIVLSIKSTLDAFQDSPLGRVMFNPDALKQAAFAIPGIGPLVTGGGMFFEKLQEAGAPKGDATKPTAQRLAEEGRLMTELATQQEINKAAREKGYLVDAQIKLAEAGSNLLNEEVVNAKKKVIEETYLAALRKKELGFEEMILARKNKKLALAQLQQGVDKARLAQQEKEFREAERLEKQKKREFERNEKRLLRLQQRAEEQKERAEARQVEKAGALIDKLHAERELRLAILNGTEEQVLKEQRIEELMQGQREGMRGIVENYVQFEIVETKAVEKARELEQTYKNVGITIKDGVVDAITAAVDRTRTLGEVASNVLRNIANQLLRLGVNQLFGAFNFGGGGGGSTNSFAGVPNNVLDSVIGERALGGAVGAGRPYMVGERGPELFVPGAQGNIVPNNAMGGANIVVNVDATGTAVQGNEGNADQLGRLIGQAVQAELIKQKRPGGLLTR